MTLPRFLSVLLARRWLALSLLTAVLGLTALVIWRLPDQFTATASVLVDLRPNDPLAAAAGQQAQMAPGYMSTQMDLIASERVILRAIDALEGPGDGPPVQRQLWQKLTGGEGDYRSWRAAQLREKLEVRPTRESGVLTIAFTAADRHSAAAVANALMRAYVDTALDLKIEPARQYTAFFDERAEKLRQALELAQTRLSDAQRNSGIVAGSDQRLDLESSRLIELSAQLSSMQALAAESSSRQRQAQSQGDRLTEVVTNPLLVALSSQLSQQQARLSELSQRLGDNHPQVRETVASISQLRSRVEAESARVASSVGLNNNVNQARMGQARQALAEQRDRVLRLKGQNDDLAVLQRDVQNAQRNYDAVQAQGARASLESQTSQAHISVLKQATPPAKRSSPVAGTALAIAAVVGLLLAIGVVMFTESLDMRLRSPEDVTEDLKLPMLVALPRRAAGKDAQFFSRRWLAGTASRRGRALPGT